MEKSIKIKRERTANFTTTENRLLATLSKGFSKIIENKATDVVTSLEKNEAWDDLALKFNATSTSLVHRSAKVLRMKYNSMKKDIKRKTAANKQAIYKTGGGEYSEVPFKDYEDTILSMMPLVDGLPSRYDSDNVNTNADCQNESIIPSSQIMDADFNEGEGIETSYSHIPSYDDSYTNTLLLTPANSEPFDIAKASTSSKTQIIHSEIEEDITIASIDDDRIKKKTSQNWHSWNPKSLKKQISEPLKYIKKSKSKTDVCKTFETILNDRKDFLNCQKKHQQKEQEMMEQYWTKKISFLEEEEKRRLKEHEIQMKIYTIQLQKLQNSII